ncbi:Cna B-type domain-containing protein [Candidatus Saccharibacteria bacterium]|nr:Cna B-type domain-containing protein [Candidatus Saccharibacteria bacterium]
MKIKMPKTKKLHLFGTFFLLATLIIGNISPITKAATNKIQIDDLNKDGAISVGDDFCIGNQCFYVIANDGTDIKAIAKYNINAGGDTYKMTENPDYQNQSSWIHAQMRQYADGYAECNWDSTYDSTSGTNYYSASRCYKRYDVNVVTLDISDRTDMVDLTWSQIDDIFRNEYGDYDNCLYTQAYDSATRTYDVTPYICYKLEPKNVALKQDPEMLSATNDEQGRLIFPMRGNIYLHGGYYTADNNLLISRDYAQKYINGHDVDDNTTISHYLYSYADSLSAEYNIKDVNLLTYNDLMHILNNINEVGAHFEDDNYLIDDDSGLHWDQDTYNVDEQHSYMYWFTSMLDYIPKQYSWIYNSTYWLATGWFTEDNTYGSPHTDEFGNEVIDHWEYYQFFVDTRGSLCSLTGACGSMTIPSGIRPVITMSADQFNLNTFFDIDGTVRWIDNSDASKKRPSTSTIRLYRNGELIDTVQVTKDDDDDLWRFHFGNLPKYDSQGNEYTYTVTQDNIPLYNSNINNFDIVNKYSDGEAIPDSPNTFDGVTLYSSAGILTIAMSVLGFGIIRRRR